MSDANLDTFMALLIKLIEKSDIENVKKIEELKKIVKENKNETSGSISAIWKAITKLNISTEVTKNKYSDKAKLIAAAITVMLTISALLIRFKTEISNLFISN